ncbi:MAG: hypothetical protein ACSLEX_02440 [Minisyncoccota bacterium]
MKKQPVSMAVFNKKRVVLRREMLFHTMQKAFCITLAVILVIFVIIVVFLRAIDIEFPASDEIRLMNNHHQVTFLIEKNTQEQQLQSIVKVLDLEGWRSTSIVTSEIAEIAEYVVWIEDKDHYTIRGTGLVQVTMDEEELLRFLRSVQYMPPT